MKPRTREPREVVENPTGKRLVKIAGLIRDQLVLLKVRRHREIRRHLETLVYPLEQLQQSRNRLALCLDKEWHVAASSITGGIGRFLIELSVASDVLERSLDLSEVGIPSLRDVVAELDQVRQEFPGLRYYPQEKILAAVTEPVELEGIELGDFETQVHLSQLGATPLTHSYRVAALDPHAAAGDDRVTHPHVRDEFLCAGEGATAIHTALSAGRLSDFFMLAWSVLSHYNGDSPYISLANWSGTACHECSYITNSEELYYCDSCEHDFCSECSSYCARCDSTTCLNCLERCPVCDESVCSGCMTTCSECEERLCVKCQEQEKCPCLEEEKETADESNNNEVPAGGEAAVGEIAAADKPGDEDEEFCIVHVNDLTQPTAEGPAVDPA